MNLRAQNLYEPETTKQIIKTRHQKKENLRPKEFSDFNLRKRKVLWTQHQVFNEPKAPKIIRT